MNTVDDTELRARLHDALDPTGATGLDERVLRALREHVAAPPRRRVPPRVGGVVVAAAVVAAFTIALVAGLGLRGHPAAGTPESVFSSGPPAVVGPDARTSFVWFEEPVTLSSTSTPRATKIIGYDVDVVDWTGALRYRFQLPGQPIGPFEIRSISADGTRAALPDGTVVDETGTAVGHIPVPGGVGPFSPGVRWATDDSAICEAKANAAQPPTSGAVKPYPQPIPPWADSSADHTVTLTLVALDGQTRSVATVDNSLLAEASGIFPDTTSVLTCNPSADIAVVARYHDATNPVSESTATAMTVSIWAIRISTGAVLFHEGETPMALGQPFFFGSQRGNLAVEFLWNSKTLGAALDRVVRIPSGAAVPGADAAAVTSILAVNSDGTRILRGIFDPQNKVTTLELVDASDGSVVRRFELPPMLRTAAVPEAHGTSFLMTAGDQLVVIDAAGRTSVLHAPFKLSTGDILGGVSLPPVPGVQG